MTETPPRSLLARVVAWQEQLEKAQADLSNAIAMPTTHTTEAWRLVSCAQKSTQRVIDEQKEFLLGANGDVLA